MPVKSRLLRKVACRRCFLVDVQTGDGTVIQRFRDHCPAHRSKREVSA